MAKPSTARAITERDEIITILRGWKHRFAEAYKFMNWYASGEFMEQYSRVEPQTVLAEVYAMFAPMSIQLNELLEGEANNTKAVIEAIYHDKMKTAADREMNANLRILEMQDQLEETKKNCTEQVKQANDYATDRIKEMEAYHRDQSRQWLAREEAKLEARIDEECRKRLMGITAGTAERKIIL